MDDSARLEALLDVQRVDSDIDRLLGRRSGLPLLTEYKKAHAGMTALDAELSGVRSHLREIGLALDRAEGEMELDEEKLQREERRLYAGGLSARDATHLRDEVEMLRGRISGREDEVLALLEQRETAEADASALESNLGAAVEEKDRLDADIKEAWSVIDSKVAELRERRAEMVAAADPELLELYESLRPGKEGVAVALLVDRVCGGCHLALSAAEELQALKTWPPRCLHCRRIVVPR